jgi:deoxyhypusine monooxygenase
MRTVFLLKQFKNHEAIDALKRGFIFVIWFLFRVFFHSHLHRHTGMKSDSVLLKHEIAYALGQLQDTYAVPFLEGVLCDNNEHPIVRHESAEALAAIGAESSFVLLKQFAEDASAPWRKANPNPVKSKYMSVDPAPPFKKKEAKTVAQLEQILLDTSRSMFDRYRAMFALRNMETEESVAALAKGFNDSSALFKHEIAFVFGQMQHKASLAALKEVLLHENEHAMVRHEAAEALGSVSATHECEELALPTLQAYVTVDPASLTSDKKSKVVDDTIVRESCEVALDIHEYWSDSHSFGGLDQFDETK